ncbi:Sodium/calcium exchanger protein-domain-containing protein [Schizophyllum fasciatum]
MASASGDLGLRPSTVNLKSRSTGELTARDFQDYDPGPAFSPNGVVANGLPQSITGVSTVTDTPSSAQGRIIRPPPFSRKLRKSLFIRPAETRGVAPGYLQSVKSALTYSWINVLLVFNPISWALYYSHQEDGAVFATALLGVIPLAGMLGHGTETVALYTGDALGGLINASLGNATEFIIAILLLVKCEIRVVQASLLGGLLSNLLLVTGMAFIVGGIRFSEQEFRQTAAQLNTSLLTLAVIALVMPTAFAIALEQVAGEDQERDVVLQISRGSAVILIAIYVSYMVFQLYSHTMRPPLDVEAQAEESDKETPEMNLTVAICALVAATGLTYVTAEALTDSLEGIGRSGSVSTEWLGLILLAIVGNAAEHVTAVFVAYRNKVDLALAVSVGSCIQITLFVIPILVLIGWIINKPLSLLFDPLEVVTLFLSVLLVRFATEDGRTHYMSGVLLFGTYILIAFSFWYYPQNGTSFARLFECT